MLVLSNAALCYTMALMTKFEINGGGERGGQKWFLEMPRAEARLLKIECVLLMCLGLMGGSYPWLKLIGSMPPVPPSLARAQVFDDCSFGISWKISHLAILITSLLAQSVGFWNF